MAKIARQIETERKQIERRQREYNRLVLSKEHTARNVISGFKFEYVLTQTRQRVIYVGLGLSLINKIDFLLLTKTISIDQQLACSNGRVLASASRLPVQLKFKIPMEPFDRATPFKGRRVNVYTYNQLTSSTAKFMELDSSARNTDAKTWQQLFAIKQLDNFFLLLPN